MGFRNLLVGLGGVRKKLRCDVRILGRYGARTFLSAAMCCGWREFRFGDTGRLGISLRTRMSALRANEEGH